VGRIIALHRTVLLLNRALAQTVLIRNSALAQTVLILCYSQFVCYLDYTLSFRKLNPFPTVQVIPKFSWFGAAKDLEMATVMLLFLLFAIRFHFRF